MPGYRIYYVATVSSFVEVEADSLDDARDRADEEFQSPGLCAQCAGSFSTGPSLDMGDWEQDDSYDEVTT